MGFDGGPTYEDAFTYLGVGQAPSDANKNLTFALGQKVDPITYLLVHGTLGDDAFNEHAGDGWREHGLPLRHHPHSMGEFVRWEVLEKKPARTSVQRGIHVLIVPKGRQNHNANRMGRGQGCDGFRGLNSVHAWHTNIHQHDVGLQLAGKSDRFDAV